ncbi:unnamed protein product [Rangifer tarandus platyrhynchus]|uniref:Uncharacterized protein n=2 Tax=Rangifer tarandus platyrhynchus TaxID=3082113 RepID=A0ACB0DPP9_RANTA|nr:unnamed protein product [Rangifer tarandus platyrhynchus]CAI9690254.1 unnamed protein product [Rangifer tarandus platyrhynchus]
MEDQVSSHMTGASEATVRKVSVVLSVEGVGLGLALRTAPGRAVKAPQAPGPGCGRTLVLTSCALFRSKQLQGLGEDLRLLALAGAPLRGGGRRAVEEQALMLQGYDVCHLILQRKFVGIILNSSFKDRLWEKRSGSEFGVRVVWDVK